MRILGRLCETQMPTRIWRCSSFGGLCRGVKSVVRGGRGGLVFWGCQLGEQWHSGGEYRSVSARKERELAVDR